MALPTPSERGYLQGRFPYVRVGDGPNTVVFVPGIEDAMFDGDYGPIAARSLAVDFRRYLDEHTIYVVSRPRGLAESASIGDMAAEYAGVIDEEIGRASVVGVSMGGLIAQDLAVQDPDLVDRLVVAVSGCRLASHGETIGRELRPLTITRDWTAIRSRLLEAMYTGTRGALYPRLSSTIGRLVPPNPAVPRDVTVSFDAVLEFDATDRLDEIESPTLVVGGTEDPFFPERILRETADGIPGSDLALFRGAKHAAFREHKATFDGLVQQFFAAEPLEKVVPQA